MKMPIRVAFALLAALACAPATAQSPIVGKSIVAPAGTVPSTAIFCDNGSGVAALCSFAGGGGGGGDASAANQTTQITAEQAIRDRLGEVQASPTANTLADRMKTLATKLDTLHADLIAATPAGAALIGKVGIDQTTPGTTNAVSVGNTVDTQSAAPGSTTATITSGTSLTSGIDLAAQRLHRIQFPATWTAASVSFQVSPDGGTYTDLYDTAGEVVVTTVAASRSIVVDQGLFFGVRYLKVRSGTAGTAVNQAADRILTLVTVAR